MAAKPFWHERGCWAIKIGRKHNDRGKQVEAWFYFKGVEQDEPPVDVITDATLKQREWSRIKSNWTELQPMLEKLDPEKDWSRPVWYKPELYAWPIEDGPSVVEMNQGLAEQRTKVLVDEIKADAPVASLDTIIKQLREAGLLPKGILAPTRSPSIREAIDEYLESQEARVALKIGPRIDLGTFNSVRNNLFICLGFGFKENLPVETVKIIDLNKPLVALTQGDIEAIANHWHQLPGGVNSKRTVKNYFDGFKRFLTWAEEREDLGFVAPKGTRKLLKMTSPRTEVKEVDYELLQAILSEAPDRTKLYAGLALFCGFYQRDICELAENEVHEIDGEIFVTGYRSKEDSENKEQKKIKTTHWIPPVLAKIMRENRAAKNPKGFYFLNRYGRPLYSEKLKGGKVNAVSKAWEKATESKKLEFKQLRKFGWNEIQLFANGRVDRRCVGETMAHRWAGQAGGGVSASYRFDDYKPVIVAQKAWWKAVGKKLFQ